MSDVTPPARSQYDENLAAARAAITGFDGPTRAGLRQTLSTWGDARAQHALQLLKPDPVYVQDLAAWNGRVAALNELAEAEGRPPRLDVHYSIEAAERHPMNVLDGTTWYEELRRDVFDAHHERALADLDVLEQQQALDQMLEMVEYGPYGVEQRLGAMRPVYDLPGTAANGRLSEEALAGRRAACKAWIEDPATQGKHAEWAEWVATRQSAEQGPAPLPFYAEVYQAGQRSMEQDLGRQSREGLDEVAWRIRTVGLSHAEEGLRSPDIPGLAERLGEAGVAGREQVLSQWYTKNWRRGTGGLDAQLAAAQQKAGAEQTAAQQNGTDQAMHAAMSGRPSAQVSADASAQAGATPAATDAAAERPAHLKPGSAPRRDGPGVGG